MILAAFCLIANQKEAVQINLSLFGNYFVVF
jgi:hypothetical protein